ncbi:MAG: endo-beta-N-acetylglucosaminidase F1, partial [Muribaculaceae bacterium]|nr:endo-beta-N-acetylglucosaminidase F1 [Muribaculaceae bacterium]
HQTVPGPRINDVLGILGNHYISGISTLQPELAKTFASEVKNLCDAYELDGVFLDDEYTNYDEAANTTIPGFQAQSTEAASRLAYEIRKAQPSRLLVSYRYEALFSAVDVDGMNPGEIFDLVLNDYGVTSNPVSTYPGLSISQAGTGSWNCSDYMQWIPANGNYSSRFSLEGMREEGYGALMIFNFNCNPGYWLTPYIVNDMKKTTAAFWNAELEYDNSWYNKDY